MKSMVLFKLQRKEKSLYVDLLALAPIVYTSLVKVQVSVYLKWHSALICIGNDRKTLEFP